MTVSPHPLHRLAEEQVKTAQESLQLAKQRNKLGLSTVVEVMLAYSARGRTQLESDSTLHYQESEH